MSNDIVKQDDLELVQDNKGTAIITEDDMTGFKPLNPLQYKSGVSAIKDLNIKEFMSKNACYHIWREYPFVATLKLVSNPYMYKTLGKAEYSTNTIHLSAKLEGKPVSFIREVFIRTVSHFIADKIFDDKGTGEGYTLIVSRFLRPVKSQSNSTGRVVAQELETA